MLVPGIRAARREAGMGWKNLGETPVVGTPWFQLNLADVEPPPPWRARPGPRPG